MLQDNNNNSGQEDTELTDKSSQPTSNVGLVGDGRHQDLKLTPAEHKETKDEKKVEETKPQVAPTVETKTDSKEDVTKSSQDDTKITVETSTAPNITKGMLFYRDKPIFGLDIGYGTVKVMQIDTRKQNNNVVGYGEAVFDPNVIKDGVITDVRPLADTIRSLVGRNLIGHIDFERAVMSIPAARTYIRSVTLPIAAIDDLENAVQLEVEQYTSLPTKELYLDFSVLRKTEKEVQLLVAAVPRKIADSYLSLAEALNIEVISLEPNLVAVSRIFSKLDRADVPTVLIDLGALSSDVIVYDNGVVTAGTVSGGGATLSSLISSKLHIDNQDSGFMKAEYGIGPGYKQNDILSAIKPQLEQIVQEVRRVMRYYMEHYENRKIDQIVITGGGSNLRGLDDYLTDVLRVPTRTFMPWSSIKFGDLKELSEEERSVFVTAGGLSLLTAKEIFS